MPVIANVIDVSRRCLFGEFLVHQKVFFVVFHPVWVARNQESEFKEDLSLVSSDQEIPKDAGGESQLALTSKYDNAIRGYS